MAEYEIYSAGPKAALDMNVNDLEVYGVSILIISRSMGELGVMSHPELYEMARG